jgi:Calcineurin-like phosphoesterase
MAADSENPMRSARKAMAPGAGRRWSGGIATLAVVFLAALIVTGGGLVSRPATEVSPTPGPPGTATAGGSASTPVADTATPAPVVTLVGAGDIASCDSSGDEATAALLDDIPGTVFTTGDNVYDNGTANEFERCYDPSWGRFRSRTRPAPGNHDYHTPAASGYFDYFGARAGDPSTGWYAYDLGTWRIYALNSNCGAVGGCDAGAAQERWLRADLAAHPAACVLAYWHHPLFSSGQHGNNPIVRPLFQALYDAGAEIVLAGHDHTYERFAPQAPGGAADPERGVVEIVVGTGGRSHYGFGTVRPNSVVRNGTTYGVLQLTLGEGSYRFEFLPVAGATFNDAGSGTCH